MDNTQNQGGKSVTLPWKRRGYPLNRAAVVVLKTPPQGVSEHLFSQATYKLRTFLLRQHLPQLRRARKAFTTWQLTGGIDWKSSILLTPCANRVEILKTEPEGVHLRMAGGAMRVGAMAFHPLAQRGGRGILGAFS